MADEINNEKLASPLVVHKPSDASYQEMANEIDVDITHIEEETATLERHRFKKEKKKSKAPVAAAVIMVLLVAAGCYLYFNGMPESFVKNEEISEQSSSGYATTQENKFKNVITVKGTYIFFEGRELESTNELVSEIKYLSEDESFIVQDEDADDTFFSEEILPILDSYNIKYEVKFIISSGLQSKYEVTSAQNASSLKPESESESSSDSEANS